MVARRVTKNDEPQTRRPPATTPEARENQLIAAAMDLAEKQLREGTASAQVITQFLKLGSSRERLEQERLTNDNALTLQKISEIQSRENVEGLYKDALRAMSTYQGNAPEEQPDDYDD